MTGFIEPDASDRQTRIAEIRRQIAAGTYETPKKLELAVEILLDRFAAGEIPAPQPKPRPK
ncbi:MAG TPA: flagellar biosynthesis anti-sigma factor FlgM [Pirellulales bacterium]|nr:flagellar biosynthesis anti-sigma factor FlgM [Pirellulales bacterium]